MPIGWQWQLKTVSVFHDSTMETRQQTHQCHIEYVNYAVGLEYRLLSQPKYSVVLVLTQQFLLWLVVQIQSHCLR